MDYVARHDSIIDLIDFHSFNFSKHLIQEVLVIKPTSINMYRTYRETHFQIGL